ncbi:MAG: hypothetical protein JSV91_04515, partial [Phycisphaerales bacterium]
MSDRRKRNNALAAPLAIRLVKLLGVIVMSGCAMSGSITVIGPGTGNSGSDSERSGSPRRSLGQPLFIVNQPLSKTVRPILGEVGAKQGRLVYQVHADPNETGVLDLNRLRNRIENYVPADYTGFVCLDFENPYNDWLWKKPDDPKYIQAEQQLVGALRMVKSMRPNAKWTVWSQPLIRLERGMYSPPAELLAELDWLSPSIYDKFPDDEEPGIDEQREFINTVIRLCREIAGDRPVLPYVWHRRPPS